MKTILCLAAALILLQSCDNTKMQLRAPDASASKTSTAVVKKDTLHKKADSVQNQKNDQ